MADGFGDDVVDLVVIRSAGGQTAVRFRSQNFATGVVDPTFGISTVTPGTANRIALTLSRADPGTNVISASYALFDGAAPVGSPVALANTELLFSNENWTRPEFLASQPVPEPETYVMMLTGALLVGWQLRRRARRSAGLAY